MTTAQLNTLNTQIWRDMGMLADSELMMKRVAKYIHKLAKEKEDSALMSEEEFMSKIERAEQQIDNGEGMEMLPNENLDDFLKRNGYAI